MSGKVHYKIVLIKVVVKRLQVPQTMKPYSAFKFTLTHTHTHTHTHTQLNMAYQLTNITYVTTCSSRLSAF